MKFLVLTKVKPPIYRNSKDGSIQSYLEQDTFFGGYVQALNDLGHVLVCKFDEGFFLNPFLLKISLNFYRIIKKLLIVTGLYQIDRFFFTIKIAVFIQRNNVDVIFTELNTSFLPKLLKRICKKVLITQWFGLFPHQIHGKDLILINESDILWTPCEYTEEVTKQFTNAKLIYLGCSVNQSHLYYDYSVDFSDDVISFGGLGGNHAERTRLMTFIASQITNFSFYGYIMKGSEIDKNLKSKVRDYLGSEKLRKAISSSKIVVNSTIDGYENVKRGFNARLFEVAACRGALQIVKADSRVLEFFEEGREIIFYSDDDDLLGKINYYLNNEIERMQIVKNAYNRVKNYTYIYRATHMQYILNKELISV